MWDVLGVMMMIIGGGVVVVVRGGGKHRTHAARCAWPTPTHSAGG